MPAKPDVVIDAPRPEAARKKRLGEILVGSGLVTEADLARALEAKKGGRKRLGEVLIEMGLVKEVDLAQTLAWQLNIPYVDLVKIVVQPEALALVDQRFAEANGVLPFQIEGRSLCVAMADPLDFETVESIQFSSRLNVRPYIATLGDMRLALKRQFSLASFDESQALQEVVQGVVGEKSIEVVAGESAGQDLLAELRQKSETAPIIKMVNLLILDAISSRASDIHLDPREMSVQVRQRIDGVLHDKTQLPKWVQGAVTSRVKIMSALDISERRLPQDGNIKIRTADKELDLRVSTLPTQFGEKVVIRILDPARAKIGLEEMGMPPSMFERYIRLVESPQGVILVTGPTGSGKTTTLYASLNRINREGVNIVTLEDPIEYNLAGVNQVSINTRAGLTFSNGLRSILRQDPDVILVGEMRDEETADIAMKASLTGHLVFSTLHTNDSVAAITRLLDMGVQPFLIASSIQGVLAQRLVRRLCDKCKAPHEPGEEELSRLSLSAQAAAEIRFFKAVGCEACNGRGYAGREGVFELLVLTPRLREMVSRRAPEGEIRKAAREAGLFLMAEHGIEKIKEGRTTAEEVLRAVAVEIADVQICGGCGATLHLEYVSCPYCAHTVRETCPGCETHVEKEWVLCPFCRYDLAHPSPLPEEGTPKPAAPAARAHGHAPKRAAGGRR